MRPVLIKLADWIDDHLPLAIGVVLAFLVLFLCLVVFAVAHAENATVSWSHPTQRVDGTPLAISEIKETQVDWGLCSAGTFPSLPAGTLAFAAPSTSGTVPNLAYGTWCFRARTLDTGGRLSDNSTVVSKVILAPPKPPVLSTVITVAYEINQTGSGMKLGRAVGTVGLGTACLPGLIIAPDYYEVSLDSVALDRLPKSAIVVSKCQPV